jgi:glutaredoxin
MRLTLGHAIVYSAMSMELKLYSREWCSWCIDAKEYLSERGYKFTEVDVGQDRQAYAEML